MKRLLETIPFFLVLLPVFYFLHLLTDYFRVLFVRDLAIPETFWFLFIPLVLFLIFLDKKPIMRRLALLAFMLVVFFFFFGPIHVFLQRIIPPISRYSIMVPMLAVMAIAFAIFLVRSRKPFYGTYRYLNVLLILLASYELIYFSLLHITDGSIRRIGRQHPIADNFKQCDTCTNPDIYYIVLDMYANSEVLKSFWNYDNSQFEHFLDSSGFYLAKHSRSNYNFTVFSIGSTFDMNYLETEYKYSNSFRASKELLKAEDNELFRILKKQGYKLYNYSLFHYSGVPSKVAPVSLTAPWEMATSQTFWYRFNNDIAWNFGIFPKSITINDPFFLAECERDLARTRKTYRGIKEISAQRQSQPVFVYAHFLFPHPPFLLDSNGNVRTKVQWLSNAHEDYLNQLKYTNKMIMDLCSTLQKEATRPRIIIVQSDHGYRNYSAKDNLLPNVELKNFSAFYFPGQRYDKLYDSISNVNTFRVVMNKYFNYNLPLLKDTSYYMLLR